MVVFIEWSLQFSPLRHKATLWTGETFLSQSILFTSAATLIIQRGTKNDCAVDNRAERMYLALNVWDANVLFSVYSPPSRVGLSL